VAVIVLMTRADPDVERKLRSAGVRAVLERAPRAERIALALRGKEAGTAR
jgi:hypothetical protein